MKKFVFVIEAVVSFAMLGSMLWDGTAWARKRWDDHNNCIWNKAFDAGFERGKTVGKMETK